MITLGRYHHLSDAKRDADDLAERGIEASIVQGTDPGDLAGGPSIELRIRREDLEKLDDLEDDASSEAGRENPYECPRCGSRAYEAAIPSLFELVSGFLGTDHGLRFKCKDCRRKFSVRP